MDMNARHFSAVQKLDLNVGTGAVICLTNERLPIAAYVAIPAWQVA
jgi:hypothetical protein